MNTHDNVPCWHSSHREVLNGSFALKSVNDMVNLWAAFLDMLLYQLKADRLDFKADVWR